MRPRLRLTSMALVVAMSGWALTGPLARVLPAPPLLAPDRWRVWLQSTDPFTAAVTMLRLGGEALTGWLALGLAAAALRGTTADAVVAARRSARVMRAARRALHAAVPRPVLATAALVLGAVSAGCTRTQAGARTQPTVTMAPTDAPHLSAPPPAPPSPPSAPPPTSPHPSPPPPGPSGWVVHRGQSMWTAAEAVVASRGGTREEVGRYWVALVRDNARPDPDLVYPGQVLALPPYPQ